MEPIRSACRVFGVSAAACAIAAIPAVALAAANTGQAVRAGHVARPAAGVATQFGRDV